jgi:hypothetical protein
MHMPVHTLVDDTSHYENPSTILLSAPNKNIKHLSPPHERAQNSSKLMHSPTSPSITTPFSMWITGYGAFTFQLPLLLLLPLPPLGSGLGLGLMPLPPLPLLLLLLLPLPNMLFVTGMKPSTAMQADITSTNISARVACRATGRETAAARSQ